MNLPTLTFDIDGTLVKSPDMPEEDWLALQNDPDTEHKFYSNLELAHPDLPKFIAHLRHTHHIGITTARTMRDKSITTNYLKSKGIEFDWLVTNIGCDERMKLLSSVKPIYHWDDHPMIAAHGIYGPTKINRVWYNAWPPPASRNYKPWEYWFKWIGMPDGAQMSLFA